MKMITLNNGVKVPILGFGTFQISDNDVEQVVVDAIQLGYRHIDTAQSYQNESGVGRAIKRSGIDRKELFITTKVWVENVNYKDTLSSINRSLQRLDLDYIDLVLIHQPYNDTYGSWRALEELQEQGKVRAIGLSNFSIEKAIDLSIYNKVTPQINQIEINPFNQQEKNIIELQKEGIVVEAWAPFAEGKDNIFKNETLKSIADKYNKTSAQVIIRWLVEQNIVVLIKTVNKNRMRENMDVFDFSLSNDDKKQIESLNKNISQFFSHTDPEIVKWMANRKLGV